jgi:hypothetical protein
VFIGSLAFSLGTRYPLKSLAFLLVKNVPKKVGGREDHLFKSLIGQKKPSAINVMGPFGSFCHGSFWVLVGPFFFSPQGPSAGVQMQ